MRQLLVLRHAKSSRDDPKLADFDRPLAERGLKTAPLIGRELAARDWVPDLALVSPALRTRDTWRLVAAELPMHPRSVFAEALYDASAADILSQIRLADPSNGCLLVVGHNPGLEDLAKQLAGSGSEAKARKRLEEKFPTAALARLVFEGDWSGLSSARLTHFLRPRDLSQ
ncbi:histidine phosphatase family protein [Mesorhizobium sp. B1-1-9]|uniref:Phosphohistidine phosphatase, SixA n=1 Tax=Mesorhizobium opportunistum (strain LMG 24607 / HAMBI 3007 / WSM2075) TaxID=536019 RepID=F7Y4W1_MESOW|nr:MULTISPECIES: histidine phosphatase family protein [Mesorhizobium]AEH89589.1 putative phosphohistidine phosphatase, SixA [Mesorhizobium opportunistum WSM2075]MCA0031900.1 histidine phosphatase family protein [Mesorhizobium sp. B263B2A]TPN54462.1 histidine phosphatase family protein [Mesorhizobium sp. B1-1-9]